jgi:hypothetical protein
MSESAASSSASTGRPVSPEKALHKLFLMLFLRGRSSRGLQRKGMPTSVGGKLWLMLGVYSVVGCFAFAFVGKPVFTLSLCMHGATLAFLGMFVAASSGELLFNKEEADILLHRPVTPSALLWAKIGVLLRVSLWLAGAFNLASFVAGIWTSDGGWLFPVAHVLSTVLEGLFCAGSVVVVYQLCLRWFGRERLEGLMTMAQIFVAVGAVMVGQIPQLFGRMPGGVNFNFHVWWIYLLPPAWFAGMDDCLAGSRPPISFALALTGVAATATVLWLAFGRLAQDYETGLQSMGEARAAKRSGGRRRLLDRLVGVPPLSWWLRDPVSRASFLLVGAYLMRDRDVKLRVYPGTAPMMVWPFIMLLNEHRYGSGDAGMFSGFGVAFAGVYVGIIPMLAVDLLRYSQQWQAADLFRVAPMSGPGPLWHGARRAVLCIMGLPIVLVLAAISWFAAGGNSHILLMIPGVLALPVYAMVACLKADGAPLGLPTEGAKAAGRGLSMIGAMMVSAILAMLAAFAWNHGWFAWMLGIECVVLIGAYFTVRGLVSRARWTSLE